MGKRSIKFQTVFQSTLLLLPTLLHGSNLGPAQGFNTFIFGDITQSNTDALGKVAAGGNVNYLNFQVGTNLIGLDTGMGDLIVGGSLTATNLTVAHGNVEIGSTGTSTIKDPTIAGYVSTFGNLNLGAYGMVGTQSGNLGGVQTGLTLTNNYQNSGPVSIYGTIGHSPISTGVDFTSAKTSLTSQAAYWATLTKTADPSIAFGGITLTGTDANLDVFYVHGTDLAAANGVTISAPANATVLINVDGANDSFGNMQFSLAGGTDDTHILYNFFQATAVTDTNVSIEGSLLAANAAFSGTGGHINGTLVASSFTGQFEQHLFLFQGNLPTPVGATPEPGTLAMLLAGCGLICIALKRKNKDTEPR